MRLSLWIILVAAFSAGMCCAFAVRSCYFEAKPAVTQTSEPTAKILVAQRTIPSGAAITGEFVIFQEVPLSEVPSKALNTFSKVYRRQPAYPIPAGCPICEDLLMPMAETAEKAPFLPAGSQFVTLDVTDVRQGNNVLPPDTSMDVLTEDQCIDIRLVLQENVQGEWAEKKNAVLQNFAPPQSRENGELLLENIQIRQVQIQSSGKHGAAQVLLVLDKEEADQLAAAAKKGIIRINTSKESQETLVYPVKKAKFLAEGVLDDKVVEYTVPANPAADSPRSDVPAPVVTLAQPPEALKIEIQQTEVPAQSAIALTKEPKTPESTALKTAQAEQNEKIGTVLEFSENSPESAPISVVPAPEAAFSVPLTEKNAEEAVEKETIKRINIVAADRAVTNTTLISDGPAPSLQGLVIKEKIRNDSSILAFGTPSVRMVSELTAESNHEPIKMQIVNAPALHTPELQTAQSEIEPTLSTFAELYAGHSETSLPESSPDSYSPDDILVLPNEHSLEPAIPSPFLTDTFEKPKNYSPFERRIYTRSSNGSVTKSSSELSAPPLLIHNSLTEPQ